jgi:glycosyltransferase involved in cell wall biosynthesis
MDKIGIIIYQPYYSRIGHFKSFFDNLFSYLSRNIYCDIWGYIGVNERININTKIKQHIYKSKNKYIQILLTFFGLNKVYTISNKNNLQFIQILDYEIVTLSLVTLLNYFRIKNKHLILHQHSINSYKNKSFPGRVYSFLSKCSFKVLSRLFNVTFLTNGERISDYLIKHVTKSTSVHTGGWGSDYEPCNLKPRRNSFLFIGILRKDKNLEYLINSINKLDFGINVTIAGYPQDYCFETLNTTVNSLDNHHNIQTFFKYLDVAEMRELYAEHEFLMIPYGKENQSNSGPLIDGLMFSCIPIVSNYGERGHIISTNNIGITFQFEEDHSLTNAIVKACDLKDSEREKMRDMIFQFAETVNWDYIFNSYINTFKVYE